MGPYKPMRPVTETWPMLFFPIHMTNLHVGSTDYYDNVCYMGSLGHRQAHLSTSTILHTAPTLYLRVSHSLSA